MNFSGCRMENSLGRGLGVAKGKWGDQLGGCRKSEVRSDLGGVGGRNGRYGGVF